MARIEELAWDIAKKVFFGPKWSWGHPKRHRAAIGVFWGGMVRLHRRVKLHDVPDPEEVAQAVLAGIKRIPGRVVVLGPFVYADALKRMLETEGRAYTFVDAAEEAHPLKPVDPYGFLGVSRLFRAYRRRSSAILDEAVQGVYLAPVGEGKVVFATHEFTPLQVGPEVGMLARVLLRGPLVYTTSERGKTRVEHVAEALGARVEQVDSGTRLRTIVIHPPESRDARELLRAIEQALLATHRHGRKGASWGDLVRRLAATLRLAYSRLERKEDRRLFLQRLSRLARV